MGAVLLLVAVATVMWWLQFQQPAPLVVTEAARFTTDPGITNDPTITPDGKLVAYASDRSGEGHLDIWVQQVDGHNPIRRTIDEADDMSPSFSPDGSKIVFRSERDGGGLYLIDTLDGEPRRLLDGGYRPQFSPDGSLISFMRPIVGAQSALGGRYKIFLVSPSGGTPQAFQPDFTMIGLSQPFGGNALWSPDGNHLLFIGFRDDDRTGANWWIAPMSGGSPVSADIERHFDTTAAIRIPQVWTENQLIFAQGTAADGVNLYSLPLESGELAVRGPSTRLTSGGGMRYGVALADDGRMLYSETFFRFNFFRVPLDPPTGKGMGEIEPITMDSSMKTSPALPEDGGELVYNANVSIRGQRVEVRRRDMANGEETIVFATPNSLGTSPCVSPDGTLIAYHDMADGRQRAHVLGGARAAGIQICQGCLVVDFTADGKQALVRYGASRLVLQELESGSQTEMLRLSNGRLIDARLSPDDKWFAFLAASPGEGLTMSVAPANVDLAQNPQWIMIARDAVHIESPRWSARGDSIYFSTEREGRTHIWLQRLDPSSKKPVGDRSIVFQPNRYQRGMDIVPRGARSIAIGPDFLVFLAGEATANLWVTSLPRSVQ
jgi:Tol biopolymer transport system component